MFWRGEGEETTERWSAEELGQGRPGRAARGPAYLQVVLQHLAAVQEGGAGLAQVAEVHLWHRREGGIHRAAPGSRPDLPSGVLPETTHFSRAPHNSLRPPAPNLTATKHAQQDSWVNRCLDGFRDPAGNQARYKVLSKLVRRGKFSRFIEKENGETKERREVTWPRSHKHSLTVEPVLLPACSSSWPHFSPALRDVSQGLRQSPGSHPVRLPYAMEATLRCRGSKVNPNLCYQRNGHVPGTGLPFTPCPVLPEPFPRPSKKLVSGRTWTSRMS